MSIRQTLLGRTAAAVALASLIATPLVAQAVGPDRALDACIDAFVDRYLPDHAVTVTKRVPAPGPLDAFVRRDHLTIVLDARSKSSGEQLAKATCVASRRGDVIVLEKSATPEHFITADFRATILR